VVLSADSNSRYISPSSATLQNVQAKLQSLADAVVTVFAVDGTPKIVDADVNVELGISQTAVKEDVTQRSTLALTQTFYPYGLLVRRSAGQSLYLSHIEDAIRDANVTGDLKFVNVKITGPAQYLDASGNLIIGKQQIVQNGVVTVKVTKRFLINGEVANA
jgi:hypothetical protein